MIRAYGADGDPLVGYGAGAGSIFKQSLAGWFSRSESSIQDNETRPDIASRARLLDMASPLARAAISALTQGVIGSGLSYAPLPQSKYFENYGELTSALKEKLDVASGLHLLDSTGRLTFGELQASLFRNFALSGDCFLIRKKVPGGHFSWRLVEERCVFTPPWMRVDERSVGIAYSDDDHYVIDGVELSRSLRPIAYWVCYTPDFSADREAWLRIPIIDRKGLPIVIHVGMIDRGDQYRGIPMLAPLIESIYATMSFQEAECQSAIIQSAHSFVITSDALNPTLDPLAAISQAALDKPLIPEDDDGGDDGKPKKKDPSIALDPLGLGSELLGGAVNKTQFVAPGTSIRLKPGEKIEPFPCNHPNSYYAQFLETQAQLIGSALRIPAEVLVQKFDSSYSASRAALGAFNRTCQAYRTRFIEAALKPLWTVFCYDALTDIGYTGEDIVEKARTLALESAWTLQEKPESLDPVKDLEFYRTAVKDGFISKDEACEQLFGHKAINQDPISDDKQPAEQPAPAEQTEVAP